MAEAYNSLDTLMAELDPAMRELLNELAGAKGSTASPDVRANAKVNAVMNALLTRALKHHGQTMTNAAMASSAASDRHGSRLVWATLALVGATLALLADPFITFWLHGGR